MSDDIECQWMWKKNPRSPLGFCDLLGCKCHDGIRPRSCKHFDARPAVNYCGSPRTWADDEEERPAFFTQQETLELQFE